MAKFAKTLVTGLAAGAALGYFLTTQKGRELKEKGLDLANDYMENPEVYTDKVKKTVDTYTNLASQTFQDYKEKFESGELTSDDVVAGVKAQAKTVSQVALAQAQELREKVAKSSQAPVTDEDEAVLEAEDTNETIIIDYPQEED